MNKAVVKMSIITLIFILCIYGFNTKEVSASPNVKIKMGNKKVTIDKGKSRIIKVKVTAGKKVSKEVTWSSTDRKVASVSRNGKVRALKTGKAVIKAVSKANKKVYAQCVVEVVINDTNKLKHERIFLPSISFKNRVVKNYGELQKCKAELEKKYMDRFASSGNKEFDMMKEKIESYNEGYFEDKVLYLQKYEYAPPYVLIGKIERVRKSNGRYIMRITITDEKFDEPYDYPAINTGGMVFVEAPRSYLKMIDKVQFKFVSQNK